MEGSLQLETKILHAWKMFQKLSAHLNSVAVTLITHSV